MKKNVASQVIGAQMVSATDGSAFTSTVSCLVTGDGGTQGAGGGAVTHEGNGFHSYAPTQAETNYDHIAFTFTGTGAIPATIQVYTTFPQTGDNYARIGAPAGASISADIAAVQSDTNDIQTRIPAALVGGLMSSDVTAISTDTTAANNLEAMLDGTGGVNLDLQQLIITAGDALPNIVLAGTGSADGISFTRTGAGNPFDAEFAAQIQSECNDAIVAYDPATGTEAAAIKSDTAAILLDTGTDGVVVAAGSKTGYSLTATTGLGNQTANITGNLSGSVGSVTAGVSVANGGIATTSFAAGAIDAAAIATDAGAEIADAILLRKLDRTGTGNDTAQERTVVNALRAIRNKVSVAAGVGTVTKEDDTTTAWTTAIATTAGDPISSSDPS